MSGQNNPYKLRLAAPDDSIAVRRVLKSGSFPGNIQVKFCREPDPYASYLADGDAVVMPVAEYDGEIIAVGCCVLRDAFVNGKIAQTGYLTGLKIMGEHRRRFPLIRESYALIHEQTKDICSLWTTTILSDNKGAIAMLEKPRKGMPRYVYRGGYTVFCVGAGGRAKGLPGLRAERRRDGIAEFYRENLPRFQLAPANERLHGLSESDFFALRDSGGNILAVCALWNRQQYKQYVVTGYSGAYRLLQRLPARMLGYPVMPRPGTPANYASIALLCVRAGFEALAPKFIRAVAAAASGYDFLMLGLHESHPLQAEISRLRHVQYTSRLYTVEFGGGMFPWDKRPVMLEVGLL